MPRSPSEKKTDWSLYPSKQSAVQKRCANELKDLTFNAAARAVARVYCSNFSRKKSGDLQVYQFIFDFEKLLFWCLARADDPQDLPNSCRNEGLALVKPMARVLGITFFSWEPSEQIFQVRRTYPPKQMDLKSYSVCYPEWGALGEMLDSLRDHRRFRRHPGLGRRAQMYPVGLFNIKDAKYSQRALPYLLEAETKKFDHILAIPVFRPAGLKKWRRNQIRFFGSEILGMFLGFLVVAAPGERRTAGTIKRPWFRTMVEDYTSAVASVIEAQEKRFTGRLPRIWKRESQVKLFRLELTGRRPELPLESLVAYLVQSLRGRFFTVEDDSSENGTKILLAAPSKDLVSECDENDEHLLRRLKSDIDHALRGIGVTGIRVTYKDIARDFVIRVKSRQHRRRNAVGAAH